MDELARVPPSLHVAFLDYTDASKDGSGLVGLHLERAIDAWVQSLRGAFYSPQKPVKGEASISKFLQLERALLDAIETIPARCDEVFWSFMVHLTIALAREPIADPVVSTMAQDMPRNQPASPTSTASTTEPTRKRKANPVRVRTQPNAPIAFVVVGALKKLTSSPENEPLRAICHRVGRENAVLRAFCETQLDPATRSIDSKLLVEVLELFQCEFVKTEAIQSLLQNLLDTKQHSSLIRLLLTFQLRVDWDFAAIMRAMIQSKDWGSAELIAKTFETDAHQNVLAKTLVDEAINLQDFKRAHRIVYNFGIQHEFPDIEQLYSRDALLKLIDKQKWTIALSYVGSDATLQSVLLAHLLASREWRLATSLARDRMGMDDFDAEKEAARVVDDQTNKDHSSSLSSLPINGYLELPLTDVGDIVFCETEESIRLAAAHVLNGAPLLVGLDVEWRPTSTKIASHTGVLTTTAVASILQIASATKVFLIDLLALHDNDYLFDDFLLPLFTEDAFVKLGFGFDSDLKVLHQTFPERAAFHTVRPFVELSVVVQKVFGATVGNSLSNATSRILGQPLDKRMQLSNWDERPLSHSQVVYAALDAYCLVQICHHIQQHGLVDDKANVTSWDMVTAEMLGSVGLSAPLTDATLIAEAVENRTQYQLAWERKLQHHGVIEAKDLVSTAVVQAYWEARADANLSSSPGMDISLSQLPVDQLQPLLAIAEEQPTAYTAVNSICFFADERPCVACIHASSKIDTSRLAALCGISRRKIKLATAMECETIWGFSPGTVPPFAHGTSNAEGDIAIFVDVTLREYDKWVAGSGSHDHLFVFSSAAFFSLITVKATSDIAIQRNGTTRQLHQDQQGQELLDPSTPANVSSSGSPEYRFLADTMVGRVGRWLRTIGIDVVIWGKEKKPPFGIDDIDSFPDRQSALLAIAAREQRIILTRDKKLADRRDAGACFVVSSDDPQQQFLEIKTHFAIVLRREDMMTRCAVCNFKGFEMVDRKYVTEHMRDAINANVLELIDEYWKCLACHKLYWVGPKYNSAYENMLAKFGEL